MGTRLLTPLTAGSLAWLLAWSLVAGVSPAATTDPAVRQVQLLDDSLLKSMHAGAGESVAARYRLLEPVIGAVFDLPLMTRLSVGEAWTTFSVPQQQAVIAAFSRLTIAGYARNFQDYGGEKFEIEDNVAERGGDKIVQSHIIPVRDAPTTVIYRVRQLGGDWRIIDVYYDGISQITMRRSDFGAAIAAGGAPTLIAHLNALSDGFLKR